VRSPDRQVSVRAYEQARDLVPVLEIARALPSWFTPSGIRSMQVDLRYQPGWVAILEDRIVGFISFFVNQRKAEIGWLGVCPDLHRGGIGRLLLERLIAELKAEEIAELYVHTLGDAVEYEPYRKTRAFYRGMGFQDFKRIANPDNPECEEDLILLLKLDDVNV
jgi:GNAT superfamily N-acetyltransferase